MARVGELHIFLFVIHLTGPSPNFLAMMFAHIMIYVNQSTMDVSMYDAQADSINVDDIAKNSNNRIVLRQLQRNEASNMYRNHYTSLYIEKMKINTEMPVHIIQRGLMTWDGWDTLLVNMSFWMGCS